ncbi:hypothetical protein GcC1_066036 [Golovinomyces cichoracearum]|uniref:Uncharacterized protein n=1 Tax=Golovinomyces cichoracearum TaxID=62708 RepID=A0A420IR99_9PEZI|nr:hypothetical protein GcC1_066036 [Golovinomyces cichoracearum]
MVSLFYHQTDQHLQQPNLKMPCSASTHHQVLI